ncbi:diguanylate cyclase [Motilimonas sp. 1_MG-2023]|uniref:Diguanylate cyclase n=1 Tax=Motilimonas cestriensis TaxID=2742685 RepID=A0ABS8WI77_9GAMM|nr:MULTISPECIES: diguanylate cyclase [Motilimonas]MCE2597065.1 diguanylate cyclase [Motilimonas cestriensis]MDO6525977.1 diguanylate cyclase [Motilimonas sp. 1_MG-2023]
MPNHSNGKPALLNFNEAGEAYDSDDKKPVILCLGKPDVHYSEAYSVKVLFDLAAFYDALPLYENLAAILLCQHAADEALPVIRQHPNTALILVFCDEPCLYPHDGNIPTEQQLTSAWQAWQQAYASYPELGKTHNPQDLLLAYLALRGDCLLTPERDLSSALSYRYPVLELFDLGDSQYFLKQAMRDELMSPVSLVDRVRQCTHCGHNKLNYVDLCPQCSSLDIKQQSAIHCFTCGHVGEQQRFMDGGRLVCPNCLTALRHIGADYDRPLENMECNSCQSFFIEAKVVARCLHCDHENDPSDLNIAQIQSFRITDKAKFRLRVALDERFSLDLGEQVSRDYLHWLVDWQLGLSRRHQIEFALLCLSFNRVEQAVDELGAAQVYRMIGQLGTQVKDRLRVTDVICQYEDHSYLLLLPNLPVDHLTVVQQKMRQLSQLVEGSSALDMAVSYYHAPSELVEGENGEFLIARLLAEASGHD